MIAYIDSSVLLRIVLAQTPALDEWADLHGGVSSLLLAVECSRSIQRLWHNGALTDDEATAKQLEATTIISRLVHLPIDDRVLAVAALPLPVPLRTLDAIHLATAIIYRRSQPDDERPIVFATHDRQLAKAATAMQFDVIGAG